MFRLSEKTPGLGPFTRKKTLHFFLPWSEYLQSTHQVLEVTLRAECQKLDFELMLSFS